MAGDERRVDVRTWRDLVASEDGPSGPGVRLLLLVIAMYMKPDGGGAYPSQELLARRTGLSLASVKRASRAAVAEGWLLVRRERRQRGQNWRITVYAATAPGRVLGPAGRGVNVTPPYTKVVSPELKVVSDEAKVVSPSAEGGVKSAAKVVSPCATNSSEIKKKNSSQISLRDACRASSPDGLARQEGPEEKAQRVSRAAAVFPGDLGAIARVAGVTVEETRKLLAGAA